MLGSVCMHRPPPEQNGARAEPSMHRPHAATPTPTGRPEPGRELLRHLPWSLRPLAGLHLEPLGSRPLTPAPASPQVLQKGLENEADSGLSSGACLPARHVCPKDGPALCAQEEVAGNAGSPGWAACGVGWELG